MNWTIAPDQHNKLIRVTTTGEMELPQLYALSAELIATGARQDLQKFLIDHRTTRVAIRAVDAMETLSELRRQGLPPTARVALIYAECNADLFQFFEDAAVNRGFQIRVFAEPAAAERWLAG